MSQPRQYTIGIFDSPPYIFTKEYAEFLKMKLAITGTKVEIRKTEFCLCPARNPKNGTACKLNFNHRGECNYGTL